MSQLIARNAIRRRERLARADKAGELEVRRHDQIVGRAHKLSRHLSTWNTYDADGNFLGTASSADEAERLVVDYAKAAK